MVARVYIRTLIAMKVLSEAISAAGGHRGAVGHRGGHDRDGHGLGRAALGTWFASLGAVEGRRSLGEAVGRNWIVIAIPLSCLLGAAQVSRRHLPALQHPLGDAADG